MNPVCPKCTGADTIRNGFAQGRQRWKCGACAYQFTRTQLRGRPLWQKSLVVFLYSYGLSLRSIARIFNVQPSTVFKWVRHYAGDLNPAQAAGSIAVMGTAEMQRHLKRISKQNPNLLCIAINNAASGNPGITISGFNH